MGIKEDFNKASTGCGCFIMLLFFAIFWNCSGCGGKIDKFWADRKAVNDAEEARANQIKWSEQERVRQAAEAARKATADTDEATRKATADAGLDTELRKFAKEFVPDLQQAIDKYKQQIEQFTEQRAVFAREMARLDVDPTTRPAYGRKGEIIEKMKGDETKLLADRRETYIRWKELNLLRDTAETKDERDKLLQNAHKAAKSAEDTFDKYMKQSLDPDTK